MRRGNGAGAPLLIACGVLVALAITPTLGPAGAGTASQRLPLPLDRWTQRAERIAHGYWQQRRPGFSCSRARVEIVIRPRIEAAHGRALGFARIGGCKSALVSGEPTRMLISDDAAHMGWVWHCSIILHEWGHLTGLDHSPRRRSLMYPVLTARSLKARVCGRAP